MNIFVVDSNPTYCAKSLCDLRLNKMILETAQMLCTAYRHYTKSMEISPSKLDTLYKPTHENHPCNIWLRKDLRNYNWLYIYFHELNAERLYRTGKDHLSYIKLFDNLYLIDSYYFGDYIKSVDFDFDFDCSMIYPTTGNVHDNYKLCLVRKWLNDSREPTWTKRGKPDFACLNIKTVRKELAKLDEFHKPVAVRQLLFSREGTWL